MMTKIRKLKRDSRIEEKKKKKKNLTSPPIPGGNNNSTVVNTFNCINPECYKY